MDMTNMPDSFQLAPDETEEKPSVSAGLNRMRLAQWMIFLSLSLLFIPVLLIQQTLTERIVTTETEIATMQALIDAPPVDPTTEALSTELATARIVEGDLRVISEQLQIENIAWPLVLQTLGGYDADHIQLTTFSQLPNRRLTLEGYARNEADVILYERQLEETEVFAAVDIRTVQQEPIGEDESFRFPIFFEMLITLREGEVD